MAGIDLDPIPSFQIQKNQKWQLHTGLSRVGLSHFSYDLTDGICILRLYFSVRQSFHSSALLRTGKPHAMSFKVVLTFQNIPERLTKFPKGASAIGKRTFSAPRSEADSSDARRFLLLDGHNFPKLGTDWSTTKNKLIRWQKDYSIWLFAVAGRWTPSGVAV